MRSADWKLGTWAAGLALALVAAGCCMPYNQLRDARNIGKGNSRLGGAVSFLKPGGTITSEAKQEGEDPDTAELDDLVPFPLLQFDFAYGVHDRVDLGFKLSTAGLIADAKIGIIQKEGFYLALDPALGYSAFLVSGGPRFDLPLIFTVGGRTVYFYGGGAYSYQVFSGKLFDTEDLQSQVLTGFAGVAFEFRSVYLKLEYAYSDVRMESETGRVTYGMHQPGVVIGVKWGEQINDIEKRLDRLEQGAAPAPALAPAAPAPPAAGAPQGEAI